MATVLGVMVAATACGDGPSRPTPSPSATPSAGATHSPIPSPSTSTAATTLYVYLMRGDHLGTAHHRVPATKAIARAAMTELLSGPTALDSQAGLSSQVPSGTRLLGLSISGQVATVNLSGEFSSSGSPSSALARLAQVTFTLTHFPGVTRVQFEFQGQVVTHLLGADLSLNQPVQRSDFESVLPPIFVEAPAPGDTVGTSILVEGTANVYEAQFRIELRDSGGNLVFDESVMATSGTGQRGQFGVTFPYHTHLAGKGQLTAFDLSATDGSRIDVVSIPVVLTQS
ncbi:MAG TPA: Gmad2 immunoglobulin-like domain-containing protein [Candidatus Nanopelagicaceae bacterium]|nr:Gmad2 immunoglobulin-like domain-containing protein [Candidatus Nanopelagicaceae bacterium]